MVRAGLIVGSHTRSHAWLTQESSIDVLDEARGSREEIERRLGITVEHFAYPDGRFDAATVTAVAAAGYRFAYTTCTASRSAPPAADAPPPDALGELLRRRRPPLLSGRHELPGARGVEPRERLRPEPRRMIAQDARVPPAESSAPRLPAVESTFRPVLALISGRTVGFIAAFLIPLVLARILDQAEFGTYKQLFLIAATLYGVGQLGMAESLYYFLPHAPRGRAGAGYVANALGALLAGGLACLVALALGRRRAVPLARQSGRSRVTPRRSACTSA